MSCDEDESEHDLMVHEDVDQHQSRRSGCRSVELIDAEASETLENACDRLALADAHRRDPVARLAAFELVQQRRGDPGAGRAERVPERDAAAVRD